MGNRSRRRALVSAALDPQRVMKVHVVTDGSSKGWVHTHGLAGYGHPELEIRGLPLFMCSFATGLLNDIAAYLLNDARKPLLPGDLVSNGRYTIQVVRGEADEARGFDAGHYRERRLTLVDAPPTGWECDECAREAAAQQAFKS